MMIDKDCAEKMGQFVSLCFLSLDIIMWCCYDMVSFLPIPHY